MKKYEKYKDSGVDWIGKIPEEWGVRKIKYKCKFLNGLAFKPSEWKSSGIPIVRIQNLNGNEEYNYVDDIEKFNKNLLLKKDDLLFSWSGNVGTSFGAYIWEKNYKAFLNQHIFKIVNFKDELRYLYWALKAVTTEIESQTHGIIGLVHVTKGELGGAFIPKIEKKEQQKISSFLDKKNEEIDEFIKNKQKLFDLLEEEKKTIITNAVTRGINPNVSYRNSSVEWIGNIPEHWEVRKTKYLFDLIVEPAKKNNDYELLSIYTDIGVKPRKDLAEKGNKASTTDGYWKVKKGDFIVNKLLAWMGAIGLSEYEGVTSPAYDILRKNIELDERFYNYIFRCGVLLTEIKRYSKGIMEMRLRLYFSEFGNIPLVYPPLKEQQLIVTYIEQESKKIDDLKEKYQKEIDLIKEYKERLIYDVVTGKMNVQNYEIH